MSDTSKRIYPLEWKTVSVDLDGDQVITRQSQLGMTLREYYAGLILVGMVVSPHSFGIMKEMVVDVVEMVDVLLAELEK